MPTLTRRTPPEQLIRCGLDPWKNKSRTLSADIDTTEHTRRVETFVEALKEIPVTWSAVAGWGSYDIKQRAATACIVTTKALTADTAVKPSYKGPAVLLHDGAEDTYGSKQRLLRQHAATQFGGGFDSRVCPVYTSALPKADLTYPEVNAADYLAGYIRHKLSEGNPVELLPNPVTRIDDSWRVADGVPVAHYRLRTTGGTQESTARSRVIAWIEGRRIANPDTLTGQKPYGKLIDRLSSERVKQYLSEMDLEGEHR